MNWFVRHLPVGWQTSEQAIQHAREYGVELAPGDTFVLPHQRRAGHTEYFCYDPEIRSTHAVAEFERAFASS